MLNIALCDDQPRDLSSLRGLLAEYQRARPTLELAVFPYSSASAVLDAEIRFDLFLLDILMPGLNGIELGQELGRHDPAAPILYLTTSRDFALDSYRTKAMSYLVKPVGREELFSTLDRAVAHCRLVSAQALPVPVEGGIRRVFYHELVCAETVGRAIHYRLPDQLVVSAVRRGSFAQLWDALRGDGRFLLVRRGCLINMDHVELLGEGRVELTGGLPLPIPRQRRKAVRMAYLDYCRRQFGAGGDAR